MGNRICNFGTLSVRKMWGCGMKIVIISFTNRGEKLADKVTTELTKLHIENHSLKKPFVPSLEKKVEESFKTCDGILFIGATGIAVRSIAPYIKSKYTDPAVVVVDEKGNYCISLLSGHIGGGNALTKQIASLIGATPVITTATDINDCFAVDVYAKEKNLFMTPVAMCKEISATLLKKEKVMVKSEFPIVSDLPPSMVLERNGVAENKKESIEKCPGIYFALFSETEKEDNILYLVPKVLTIGIGCRKGASYEKIENAVVQSLKKLGARNQKSVSQMLQSTIQIASIDVKKEEVGICQFVGKYHLPFITFPAEELNALKGTFTHSDFVEQTVGVDNVCERAALKACGSGKTIMKKEAYDGVTVAIAMSDWSVDFV